MLQRFEAYINRTKLIESDDKIILALSGGIDSMVLADLLLKAKVHFVVAHCNFHLRGEESDGDEQFVHEFAVKHKIQFFVKHFETENYAIEKGISIEMAARDLRYAWFEEMRQKLGYDKIAVAHHADDQAETFFINLLRGAGLRGLKGMQSQNGHIIRPMLWASREQIHKYAVENQIVWHDDHTNGESVYLRNKIRNKLLPIYEELQPDARQGLYKSIEHLSTENELYRTLLKEKFNQIIAEKDCCQSVDKQCFVNNFQLLFEWLRQYGFNTEQCHFIHEAMELGIGNHYFSPTHQLVVERNDLQLSEIKKNSDDEIHIELGEKEIHLPVHMAFSRLEKTTGFLIDQSRKVAQLDFVKLQFPLTLRHWRHGDRFHPLGMKGSKLLSDFFVDQKFTDKEKQNVLLLVSGTGDIVWLVGYRIDERFKVSNSTKTIFVCRVID